MDSDPSLTENPDALVLKALKQRVRQPSVSLLYGAGLGLITLAMLVLPLVSLAIVGAAGYALYYHWYPWIPVTQGQRVDLLRSASVPTAN